MNYKSNQTLSFLFLLIYFILNAVEGHAQVMLTDFGAVPDGKTLNTKAIQYAIDKVNANGGGKIIVPGGRYLTGTIELKSNVELHLLKNAVLLGSTNPVDYTGIAMDGRPKSPKQDDNSQMALLVAYNANNISITGNGTINGQGRQLALNIDSLHHAGIVTDPNYGYQTMRPSELMRPKLIRFSTCKNITFSGVTFSNSSCWGLSFELCNNLVLDRINIDNCAYWNNDGMDITDSKNVRITHCHVNSADDGICLKSYYPGYCNDSIYIANCTIRSSASAIKFGTASYGGFKNVTIEKIKVYDTYRSAIAIESVDGGFIENIKVSNVIAKNTGNAIFIRLGHRDGKKPGIINNVTISDMKVQVPFIRADIKYDLRAADVNFHHNPFPASIVGIPEHHIQNLVLENIKITFPGRASKAQAYIPVTRLNQVPECLNSYPEYSMFGELPAWGFYVRHVNGLIMKNIILSVKKNDYRPAIVFDDVDTLHLSEIMIKDNLLKQQIILKDVAQPELSVKPSWIDIIEE